MKHRMWFTLAVRLLGLYFVGSGLPRFLNEVAGWLNLRRMNRGIAASDDLILNGITEAPIVLVAIGAASQLAFGLYLFFGGRWIINRCLREVGCVSSAK